MIRLADGLNLPVELATQTALIVGKRGSGKTNTCVVLAEQLHHAKVPFVALDPADVWWGLKASRDGKGPALAVHVFGGRHADLPLEPGAGALMADVLVDHRISAVLSVRHFTGGERNRFVTDFARRLLQRNTEPFHVFLEEAHELAPQDVQQSDVKAECVGAVTRLSKLGRSSGIGVSAITQRPASLSKNITTQAEILIVHRLIGPQDVKAVREWIKYHGEHEELLSQLSGLKTGECFLWAPDFPEAKPIGLVRVRIAERETFDSSATPKTGEKRVEPKQLAPVDLEALRERMAATIERAKADDPKALRARITELDRELAAARRGSVDPAALDRARSEGRAAVADGVAREAHQLVASVVASAEAGRERASRALDQALEQIKRAADALREPIEVPEVSAPSALSIPRRTAQAIDRPIRRQQQNGSAVHAPASGGEARMLTVLAQHFPQGLPEGQWATLSRLKRTGGTWTTYKSRLRARGHFEERGGLNFATDAGVEAAGVVPERPTTTEEVLAMWEGKPGMRPAVRLVRIVLEHGGRMAPDVLAAAADLTHGAGTFSAYLSRARTAGLLDADSREIIITEAVLNQ